MLCRNSKKLISVREIKGWEREVVEVVIVCIVRWLVICLGAASDGAMHMCSPECTTSVKEVFAVTSTITTTTVTTTTTTNTTITKAGVVK